MLFYTVLAMVYDVLNSLDVSHSVFYSIYAMENVKYIKVQDELNF